MNSRAVTAFAPGSIGNVGPGLDILGAAVEGPGDEVSIAWSDEPGITVEEPGTPELPRDAKERRERRGIDGRGYRGPRAASGRVLGVRQGHAGAVPSDCGEARVLP